jgi:microcystin synthetase protein McyG
VAAVNGPENTVISGAEDAVREVERRLEEAGIRSQPLRVGQGFHSPEMEGMQEEFAGAAEKVRYGRAEIGLVSNLTGRVAEAGEMERAEYWVRQLREPVRFWQGMETLREQGCGVFLEIGPKPTLVGLGQECLGAEAGVWLNSLREGRDDWQEMLTSVGQLYRHGVDIEWAGFYRDYGCRRVALPTYPFQRKRYWFETATTATQEPEHAETIVDAAAAGETPDRWREWIYETRWEVKARAEKPLASDFLPIPSETANSIESQRAVLNSEHQLDLYGEIIPQLDRLAALYIAEAVGQLGWRWIPHRRVPVDSVAELLGVAQKQRRFLARLFGILREEGFLREIGGEYEIRRSPETQPRPESSSTLMVRYPQMSAEVSLLERCGRHLAGVLSGKINPIEVLFPGGSIAALEALYQDSPAARACNTLIKEAVSEAVRRLPQGRKIRILELGGGTGGTTSFVLPALPPLATEYVFTDVSPQFAAHAESKFRAFPFLRCEILDIERDPAAQGFEPRSFDLVLAANVLHATADVRQTLTHVEQLLVPNGLLLLLEGTGPQRWLDLIFGMTEGWWKFADGDLRPSHPLLTADQWLALLQRLGFSHPVSLPRTEGHRNRLPEPALILAQAPTLETTPVTEEKLVGNWLIFADRRGVAKELAAGLRKRGHKTVLVFPGECYEAPDESTRRVNPARPEDLRRLLQDVITQDSSLWRGVVHLWSLDSPNTEGLTVDALEAAQVRGCGSVLHLTQALAQWKHGAVPRLWLVTRAAQHTSNESLPPAIAQAPLWGLGRVVALEHPDLWGGIIDLMADASAEAAAKCLIKELTDPDGEDQIALRGDKRYVARLIRSENLPVQSLAPRFAPDGTYMVTGGFGDLGLKVANWLVQGGARHIVLIGRSGLPERSTRLNSRERRSLDPKIAAIETLERAGAAVRLVRADVADFAQMSAVFEQIQNEGVPLRGIVHAAAEITAQTLQEMNLEILAQGLLAKVSGTWILHELTRQMDLEFFVLFSSTTSVLGSRYLAHYAAANQFVDAFAHFRKALGKPALAINWGIWDPNRVDPALGRTSLKQIGLREMASPDALAALGHLMKTGAVQMAVADIDWGVLKPLYEARRRRPFLEKIRPGPRRIRAAADQDLLRRFEQASAVHRHELIVDYIQREVGRVLGFDANSVPDTQQGFFELGMDSLTSVELKNRLETALGRPFPTTLVLEYPNIEALAGYVATQLFGAATVPTAVEIRQAGVESRAYPDNLDQLSKESLLSLMAQELAAIEEQKK